MTSTKADYVKRKTEIEKYFQFLSILDNSNSKIQYNDIAGITLLEPIDEELLKILKANGFLLLYNLIESTVLKSIQSIFNQITDEGLTFPKLSDNLKKLWVNNKGVPLKGIDDINLTKVRQLMRDVADSIVDNQIAQLSVSCVNINGNIDAQEIRNIAKQFGFDEIPNGRHLVTIKNKRNHLAHGEFSFSDIGKEYSVNDLNTFKNDAYIYLENLMNNIDIFINDNKYSLLSA